jgi:hypothetical protein
MDETPDVMAQHPQYEDGMPHASPKLQAAFRAICQVYFPRWHTATAWTLREGPRERFVSQERPQTPSETGFCDTATKTIWIHCRPDAQTETLIHKICHAVTGLSHDKRWRTRLRAVGLQATRQGDAALAAKLFGEANAYAEAPRLTATAIYQRVQEVLVDNPATTYERMVEYLAHAYAFTGPELLARCPRLQHVYAHDHRQMRRELQRTIHVMKAVGASSERLESIEATLQAMERSAPR